MMMNEIKVISPNKIAIEDNKFIYADPCYVEPTIITIEGERMAQDIALDNNIRIQRNVKCCFISVFMMCCFPIIICDLYYANTYGNCLSQTTVTMEISMYEYLIVNSIYGIISLLMTIITISFVDAQTTNITDSYLFKMIGKINMAFNIMWTCIGSVIFWAYLNKRECSNDVDNYLKISLIIKIIIMFIQIITNSCNK